MFLEALDMKCTLLLPLKDVKRMHEYLPYRILLIIRGNLYKVLSI